MDQKEIKLLSVLLINSGVFYIQRIKKRKKKPFTEILLNEKWLIKRDSVSSYKTIFKELHLNDQENFLRYLRMNTEAYEVNF